MSEPKPWDLWEVILEETDSKWVRWEDYASLKAEVERLTKENALATPRHLIASQDITSLREQVERLTKAGDAMVDMVDWEVPYERRKKLEADWNAAKEGNGQP
jgi:predicted nucleotidyltransferase